MEIPMSNFLLLLTAITLQAAPPEIVALTSPQQPVFEEAPISTLKAGRISEKAWHNGCPAEIAELHALTLSYWDFHGMPRTGVLVVNREVAADVLFIFRKLFEHGFLIQSIRPIEDFAGSDESSMEVNNTSGFNCRDITGQPGKFSNHSWGRAIDINPLTNPMILNGNPLPPQGGAYRDRTLAWPGSILDESFIVNLFRSRGWTWGGEWKNPDYQHFEKPEH
jgi:hypothetical protein